MLNFIEIQFIGSCACESLDVIVPSLSKPFDIVASTFRGVDSLACGDRFVVEHIEDKVSVNIMESWILGFRRCNRITCLMMFFLSIWSHFVLVMQGLMSGGDLMEGRYLSSSDFAQSFSGNQTKWNNAVDLRYRKSSTLPMWMKGKLQ